MKFRELQWDNYADVALNSTIIQLTTTIVMLAVNDESDLADAIIMAGNVRIRRSSMKGNFNISGSGW
jgi:hypothetical protein